MVIGGCGLCVPDPLRTGVSTATSLSYVESGPRFWRTSRRLYEPKVRPALSTGRHMGAEALRFSGSVLYRTVWVLPDPQRFVGVSSQWNPVVHRGVSCVRCGSATSNIRGKRSPLRFGTWCETAKPVGAPLKCLSAFGTRVPKQSRPRALSFVCLFFSGLRQEYHNRMWVFVDGS